MTAVLRGLWLIANVSVLAYLLVMAFLYSGWFIDDSVAVGLTDAGWRAIVVERFLYCAGAGAIGALAAFFVNRVAVRRFPSLRWRRLPLIAAIATACGTIGGALLGAVRFLAERPFM